MNNGYLNGSRQYYIPDKQSSNSDNFQKGQLQHNYLNGNVPNSKAQTSPVNILDNNSNAAFYLNSKSTKNSELTNAVNNDIIPNNYSMPNYNNTNIQFVNKYNGNNSNSNSNPNSNSSTNISDGCNYNSNHFELPQFSKHLANINKYDTQYPEMLNEQQYSNSTTVKIGSPTIIAATDVNNHGALTNIYKAIRNSYPPGHSAIRNLPKNNSKRAVQNRNAQKAFRQRKKKYIQDLEIKAKQYDNLFIENNNLKIQLKELTSLIKSLKE